MIRQYGTGEDGRLRGRVAGLGGFKIVMTGRRGEDTRYAVALSRSAVIPAFLEMTAARKSRGGRCRIDHSADTSQSLRPCRASIRSHTPAPIGSGRARGRWTASRRPKFTSVIHSGEIST